MQQSHGLFAIAKLLVLYATAVSAVYRSLAGPALSVPCYLWAVCCFVAADEEMMML